MKTSMTSARTTTALRKLVRTSLDLGENIKTLEAKKRDVLAEIAALSGVNADNPAVVLPGLAAVRFVTVGGRKTIDRARLLERGVDVEDVDYATVEGEATTRVQVYAERAS